MTDDAVWGALPGDRYVLVMAVDGADGLWDAQGMVRWCEDMPIPQGLIDRIRAWQTWYDDTPIGPGGGTVPELLDGFDLVGFQTEAEAIAADLRAALPADWMVACFDHGARARKRAEASKGERRRL